jgi:hypothetical protein
MTGVLLACGDHQRCSGDTCVQQIAQAMAKPASRVEIEDARSAGSLRVAIRHRNRAGLLQRPHVAYIGRVDERIDQRQFGGSRIAKDIARAFAP